MADYILDLGGCFYLTKDVGYNFASGKRESIFLRSYAAYKGVRLYKGGGVCALFNSLGVKGSFDGLKEREDEVVTWLNERFSSWERKGMQEMRRVLAELIHGWGSHEWCRRLVSGLGRTAEDVFYGLETGDLYERFGLSDLNMKGADLSRKLVSGASKVSNVTVHSVDVLGTVRFVQEFSSEEDAEWLFEVLASEAPGIPILITMDSGVSFLSRITHKEAGSDLDVAINVGLTLSNASYLGIKTARPVFKTDYIGMDGWSKHLEDSLLSEVRLYHVKQVLVFFGGRIIVKTNL